MVIEYIKKADAVFVADWRIFDNPEDDWDKGYLRCAKSIKSELMTLPTILLAQQKACGEWVDNGVPDSMLSKCSLCGYSCGAPNMNYCPNCGADMRGHNNG